jgi:hypothetical protein
MWIASQWCDELMIQRIASGRVSHGFIAFEMRNDLGPGSNLRRQSSRRPRGAGKDPFGTLRLRTVQEGGHVLLAGQVSGGRAASCLTEALRSGS